MLAFREHVCKNEKDINRDVQFILYRQKNYAQMSYDLLHFESLSIRASSVVALVYISEYF